MMEINHVGACATRGCELQGVEYSIRSIDGELVQTVCGVCGVDFTSTATLLDS